MDSANVDLVASIFAGWERGDYSWTEWAHPEIEFVFADGPTPGRWSGLSGLAEAWGDFLSVWEGFSSTPESYRELDDDRVLAFAHYGGRGRTSGLEVAQIRSDSAGVFHFHDGKVTRLVFYFDRERALADVGLAPERKSRRS
jgi:ketosteroid isomerase-like protein